VPLFGTRLRVLRAEREWSQAKLAAQVGVKRQTINCIEKADSLQPASGLQNCPHRWMRIAGAFIHENI
jgi:transcriptional regulator with XRE-family HTH domain